MIKVLCVLRSGGVYWPEYVSRLQSMVSRHLDIPHEFVCVSDLMGVPLLHGWPGWWSKLELFRFTGPVLYLDLDTVVLRSLDSLANAIYSLSDRQFLMLRAFSPKYDWASGIMGWNGDFRFVYETRLADPGDHLMDQCFIRDALLSRHITIRPVQGVIPGIYSYLWHCQERCPQDAAIICFHKHPKPHEVTHSWTAEHWR